MATINGTLLNDDDITNPKLVGTADADQINGYAGNDFIEGGAGNDLLRGWEGDDTIFGGDGNDQLQGGPGVDTYRGGDGNDFYSVDNSTETITDTDGRGTVVSSVEYSLSDRVTYPGYSGTKGLGLTLTGDTNINGTGDNLSNNIYGNSGDNTLQGLGGNDLMKGGGGTDILEGGEGDDILEAKDGDTLRGGLGNDRYNIIGDGTATIIEFSGSSEGIDVVYTNVDGYTLPEHVENLTLYVTGSNPGTVTASGNRLDNLIIGNRKDNILSGGDGADIIAASFGDDTIIGGSGADELYGGPGADTYLYTDISEGGDILGDFEVGIDKIELQNIVTDISQVQWVDDGSGNTLIQIDPNNSGVFQDFITVDIDVTTFDQEGANNFQLTSASPTTVRIEAESMTLAGYSVEPRSFASGSSLIANNGPSGTVATATTAFSGLTGNYDIVVTYHDETDGVASLSVYINDELVDTWEWNASPGGAIPLESNRITRLVASSRPVTIGDSIRIEGTRNSGEFARVDYIEFMPATPPVTSSSLSSTTVDASEPILNENTSTSLRTTSSSPLRTTSSSPLRTTSSSPLRTTSSSPLRTISSSNLSRALDTRDLTGTRKRDRIEGTSGDDVISGGRGRDILSGGDGADTFVYNSIKDRRDRITDFEPGVDKIDLSAFVDDFDQVRFRSGRGGTLTKVQVDTNGDRPGGWRTMIRLVDVAPSEIDETSFIL